MNKYLKFLVVGGIIALVGVLILITGSLIYNYGTHDEYKTKRQPYINNASVDWAAGGAAPESQLTAGYFTVLFVD